MPVTFDNVASENSASTAGPYTFTNFQVAEQTNRYMIVAAGIYSANPSGQLTGVTYDGVAMTRLFREPGSNDNLDVFGLVAPHSGAHDVVVSWAASMYHTLTVLSYYGVDQRTPVAMIRSSSSPVNTFTFSLQTVVGAMVVDMWCGENLPGNQINDASQRQRSLYVTNQPGGTSDKPGTYPTTSTGWKTGDYQGYGALVLNPADPVRWGVA